MIDFNWPCSYHHGNFEQLNYYAIIIIIINKIIIIIIFYYILLLSLIRLDINTKHGLHI